MGGAVLLGTGNLSLICLGPNLAPPRKLNTTEAHLQRLQNYAAGTVTMTIITDFSPPPVVSMTHLLRHKKSAPRRTFLDVEKSEQPFLKPWQKWSCDQVSFNPFLHEPFHFMHLLFQRPLQTDVARYGTAHMPHRRLPSAQRVRARSQSPPCTSFMLRRSQSPC